MSERRFSMGLVRVAALAWLVASIAAACSSDDPGSAEARGSGASGAPSSGAPSSADAGDGPTLGNAGNAGGNEQAGGGPSAIAGATGEAGAAGSAGAAGAGGEPTGVSLAELCEQLPRLMCEWVDTCRFWTNRACNEWWGTHAVEELCVDGVKAVDAGLLEYDPIAGRRCLDESQVDCSANGGTPFAALGRGACARMLKGTVPIDGDCYSTYLTTSECAGGFCSFGTCPGTCQPLIAPGGACSGVSCVDGYHCQNLKCVADLKEGDECASDACPAGLFCNLNEHLEAYVCSKVGQVGDACSHTGQCPYESSCVGGKCKAAVAAGDPCRVQQQCPTGLGCVTANDGYGKCEAAPGEGQACEGVCGQPLVCRGQSGGGSKCEKVNASCDAESCPDGFCSGDVCKPLLAAGASCTGAETDFHRECQVGFSCIPVDSQLSARKCQKPGTAGDPCEDAFHCQLGSFCNPVTHTCEASLALDEACSISASCATALTCRQGSCKPRDSSGTCRL